MERFIRDTEMRTKRLKDELQEKNKTALYCFSHVCFLSLLSLPSQESILQKVVMTAFADRTVVTIAVSISPTTLCRSLRRLQ